MDISIRDIINFIQCPMSYKLSLTCEKDKYLSIDEKYIAELQKAIYFLFYEIQNDGERGYLKFKGFKRYWGNIWVGKRSREDLLRSNNDGLGLHFRKRERDGNDAIYNIWNKYTEERELQYSIVGVNESFTIPLGNDIMITGSFPVIRTKGKAIEILQFRTLDENFHPDYDLETSIISYAFRKYFNKKETRIITYITDRNKEYTSTRSDEQNTIAITSCKEAVRAMKNSVKYRCLNITCKQCLYRINCLGG